LDICSNQGAKREMGGHRFQMGRPGTTGPPLATALPTGPYRVPNIFLKETCLGRYDAQWRR